MDLAYSNAFAALPAEKTPTFVAATRNYFCDPASGSLIQIAHPL